MNTVQRYRPKPDPQEYAKLLGIAGTEIRQADPGAEILPGGMFGTPQTPNSYDAWDFMRMLLAAARRPASSSTPSASTPTRPTCAASSTR